MVHTNGAPSKTHFRVLKNIEHTAGRFSLVEAEPVTGRTHQIRVHASFAGHPVVGDKIYGPSEDCYLEFIQTGWTSSLERKLLLKRHALHSVKLKIEWNGVSLEWKTGWPEDLKKFMGNIDIAS